MDSEAAFLVPPSLHVVALLLDEDGVTIHAISEATDVRCPVCGEPSGHVHSRYQRTVADLPWARFAVRLQIQVRRFVGENLACPHAIFAERLAGIAPAAARRTARQRARLTDLALALGGEEGSRLAVKLGMPVSPDTLLRLIRSAPEAERPTPTALGVDDWAIHKGLTYGTILVDLERHRVARRREKYEQARTLHATGASVAQIARTVGIARMTVYKYLREGPPQRKRHSVHGRQRVLAPYEPYLLKRWAEGCRMATVLWREICAQGFAHSLTNVQRFVAQLRREGPPPADWPRTALTKAHGPPPRQVVALVLRRPERRTAEQRADLQLLRAEDAAIATAVDLAEDYLGMVRRREGERLATSLDAAEASGVGDLARLAGKLRVDRDAVQAGLTLRHSNGQTEGHVKRLKLVKRQGYGRAKVDLIRKRVLRAT